VERKKPNTGKTGFEDALSKLEDIALRLENGEMGLDESISAFEKGMEYARLCHQKLEEAERKIELLQKGESGIIEAKELRVRKDTGEILDDEEVQGSLL
jgi:exodeoxyribonuclease VII small subunit